MASQLAVLESELAEYDSLKAGNCELVEVQSLTELPETLIKARIAAGLSQRELANRLGLFLWELSTPACSSAWAERIL